MAVHTYLIFNFFFPEILTYPKISQISKCSKFSVIKIFIDLDNIICQISSKSWKYEIIYLSLSFCRSLISISKSSTRKIFIRFRYDIQEIYILKYLLKILSWLLRLKFWQVQFLRQSSKSFLFFLFFFLLSVYYKTLKKIRKKIFLSFLETSYSSPTFLLSHAIIQLYLK